MRQGAPEIAVLAVARQGAFSSLERFPTSLPRRWSGGGDVGMLPPGSGMESGYTAARWQSPALPVVKPSRQNMAFLIIWDLLVLPKPIHGRQGGVVVRECDSEC